MVWVVSLLTIQDYPYMSNLYKYHTKIILSLYKSDKKSYQLLYSNFTSFG